MSPCWKPSALTLKDTVLPVPPWLPVCSSAGNVLPRLILVDFLKSSDNLSHSHSPTLPETSLCCAKDLKLGDGIFKEAVRLSSMPTSSI